MSDDLPTKTRDELAGRWKRTFGYLIDKGIVVGMAFALLLVERPNLPRGLSGSQALEALTQTRFLPLGLLFYLLILAMQAALLAARGQTVGKMIVGTRIVDMRGMHPAWWRLIIVRPILPALGSLRPENMTGEAWGTLLGILFGGIALVDAVFMFNEDRRTLHDLMAQTQVIDRREGARRKHVAISAGAQITDST